MKTKTHILKVLLVCLTVLFSGCATTKHARDFSGLSTPHGDATYLSTYKYALHFLFGRYPLLGDASLEQTVVDFTAAAKAEGASKVRIVQSGKMNWWFIFPPFSFLLTPVSTHVEGDAIR